MIPDEEIAEARRITRRGEEMFDAYLGEAALRLLRRLLDERELLVKEHDQAGRLPMLAIGNGFDVYTVPHQQAWKTVEDFK